MASPLINITIPVYNEEQELGENVAALSAYLQASCLYPYELVIADNASTDTTLTIAQGLVHSIPFLQVLHISGKGRGRAVKEAWNRSQADILTFMDLDLATDLQAFPLLIGPLIDGEYDVATGSRLLRQSITRRGLKRELLSRGYNHLVKAMFDTHFSDAQCGFKAMTRLAAQRILPLVQNHGWVMDTELLVIAEKLGFRLHDLPVRWTDDPDSRVKIGSAIFETLYGLGRLRRQVAQISTRSSS